MKAPICRVARAEEVALMLDWAAGEGWNPGLEDAEAFRATDPEGFFVATVDGTPVAAISVVNHSDGFAFLGLYLCRPAWRGQGIGFRLWQHALIHAGDRTVGLDGVAAQQSNYARSGFVHHGSTRRLQGNLPPSSLTSRLAEAKDLDLLARLDGDANGAIRSAYLSGWVRTCDTRKTVVLDAADGIAGFATARLCREGCKIGPVIAPNSADAIALATQAAAALGQTEVIIDVPDSRPKFDRRLRDMGFVETFATARMYRGPAPETGPLLQAITTMELG